MDIYKMLGVKPDTSLDVPIVLDKKLKIAMGLCATDAANYAANRIRCLELKLGEDYKGFDESHKPLWIAADVGEILGIANVRQNLAGFPEDEKGVCTVYTPGGLQQLQAVTEPGLYRLIFQSRKPEAEGFKRWVFHEVLPTINRTGSYSVPNQDPLPLVGDLGQMLTLAINQAFAQTIAPVQTKLDLLMARVDQLSPQVGTTALVVRDPYMGQRTVLERTRELRITYPGIPQMQKMGLQCKARSDEARRPIGKRAHSNPEYTPSNTYDVDIIDEVLEEAGLLGMACAN